MRRVAPDRAGAEASQNSWLVEYLKPIRGKFTATTLHSCQMAKARKRAGTDSHRLSLAMAWPCEAQKALSSGVQTARVLPGRARSGATVLLDMGIPFERL